MATSMYLKFEMPSIAGSSQAPGHAGEIEILSWSHGFVQPTSPTRSTALDQATHQNLTFTKYIDTSTNDLLKHCWSGNPFGKVTLSCYRSDGRTENQVEYLTIVLEHVIVSNYSISGGAGDIPVENVSLDYGVIQYNYKEQRLGSSSAKILSAKHNLETRTVE
jgi:type VI secretion system secreted protein Hcp